MRIDKEFVYGFLSGLLAYHLWFELRDMFVKPKNIEKRIDIRETQIGNVPEMQVSCTDLPIISAHDTQTIIYGGINEIW